MQQALLTTQDVKNFIIEAVHQDRILDRQMLSKQLGISFYHIKKYVKEGMPWMGTPTRRKFYVADVEKWLQENNIKYKKP